jgi:hypothetical protein
MLSLEQNIYVIMIITLIINAISGIVSYVIAKNRERNKYGFGLLGFIFGIPGAVVTYFFTDPEIFREKSNKSAKAKEDSDSFDIPGYLNNIVLINIVTFFASTAAIFFTMLFIDILNIQIFRGLNLTISLPTKILILMKYSLTYPVSILLLQTPFIVIAYLYRKWIDYVVRNDSKLQNVLMTQIYLLLIIFTLYAVINFAVIISIYYPFLGIDGQLK